MQSKICFFIGHREAGNELLPALADAVEHHITALGVTQFVVGRYGNFDALAAQTVLRAKERHPSVRLTMLLAYHPHDQPVTPPDGFDDTLYPAGMETVPRRAAIVRAGRYMVDHCTHLIAYAWHPASNARTLVEYAQARQRQGRELTLTLLAAP